jgi:5,10-methylenetetrahydromethanopterin reductase
VKLSLLFPENSNVDRAIARIEKLEAQGFHSAVMGTGFGFDPIMAFALAGQRTERILLTTAVVPTYSRHPISMAMSAATAQVASKGRFRLGLGPSHKPLVEHMYGLSYERPVRHMSEYITVVRELLQEGATKFEGEMIRSRAQLSVDDAAPTPVLMSALGEQMCRTAGRVADGVLPWLAPPEYVENTIAPAVTGAAAELGRSAPPIIAETACVLSSNRDEVMAAVRQNMDFYLAMPAYRALFERAGLMDSDWSPAQGWTEQMVDAVIPWGSEDDLAAAVNRYIAAGADEVVLSPVGAGSDPAANYERAIEVLGEIARQ